MSARPELQRRYYVTTDGAGIAITRPQGSLALDWTEIKSARKVGRRFPCVILDMRWIGRVKVRLYGHEERQVRELIHLIADQSNLVQPSLRRLAFYRSGPESAEI